MKKFTIKCIKCSENNNLLNTYKDNIAEERGLNDLAELFKVFGYLPQNKNFICLA